MMVQRRSFYLRRGNLKASPALLTHYGLTGFFIDYSELLQCLSFRKYSPMSRYNSLIQLGDSRINILSKYSLVNQKCVVYENM